MENIEKTADTVFSLRLSTKISEQFKTAAKNAGLSQGDFFTALLDSYEKNLEGSQGSDAKDKKLFARLETLDRRIRLVAQTVRCQAEWNANCFFSSGVDATAKAEAKKDLLRLVETFGVGRAVFEKEFSD